jgi:hypothetical protein
MSGGCLQPKVKGGVAELMEGVEREAGLFDVEACEQNGEEKVSVQEPKLFQEEDAAAANVAFVIRNKREIHFNDGKPLGVRHLALRVLAREFVQTEWSGLKWEKLIASPAEEITKDFFYEKRAEFLIRKLDGSGCSREGTQESSKVRKQICVPAR